MRARVNRGASVAMFAVVLLGFSGLGYGVAKATEPDARDASAQTVRVPPAVEPERPTATDDPTTEPRPEPTRVPTPEPSQEPKPTEKPETKPTEKPTPAEKPGPTAGPPLLEPGDRGEQVRELQARLRQIAWFTGDVTDYYGPVTTESVRGFQAKRGIAVTGYVDQETLDRLHAMTREPSAAELANQLTPMGNQPGALDARCTTGRVLCVDKSSRTLRWVVDGKVARTVDVRFGSEYTPTREGVFTVYWKHADHVSSLYGSEMPYSMFFSRGQAIHYSSDFAARGYNGASHGCVNVRDYEGIQWIYGQVREGDRVVVYWS